MSLTSSLRKVGSAVDQADRAAILARAREYRAAGMSVALAANAAVDTRIAYVRGLIDSLKRVVDRPKPPPEVAVQTPSDPPPAAAGKPTSAAGQQDVEGAPEDAAEPAEQPAPTASDAEDGETPTGSTVESVRSALQLRFGDLVGRMERRGLLCIADDTEVESEGPEAACVEPSDVEQGREVAAFLYACGGEASLQEMLGGDLFDELFSRAEKLAEDDDPVVVKAEQRIPDDVRPRDLEAWLVATTIEVAAEQMARPLVNSDAARQLLMNAVKAARSWWTETDLMKKLDRYGQAIELTPTDVGALAVYAACQASDDD